jgi:hypothetical protein
MKGEFLNRLIISRVKANQTGKMLSLHGGYRTGIDAFYKLQVESCKLLPISEFPNLSSGFESHVAICPAKSLLFRAVVVHSEK